MKQLASFLSAWLLALPALFAEEAPPKTPATEKKRRQEQLFFEQHIRPLLIAKCQNCHGSDKQKGGLRLDSRAALLAGGESGAAYDETTPRESLLLSAVRYESLEMPPNGKLADRQIELLERWVAMGAPWPGSPTTAAVKKPRGITEEDRQHWAYQPVVRPDVPASPNDSWSRTPIDRFILRRLDEAKLTPSPTASPVALIRRLYFNVIGLPPTPEEIDAFVRDPSDRAYSELVDALLERPEYGEKWASHWLDLVRYAESDGYKQDAYRPLAWRYRDYVIASFNDDKPYDQFVREQIAGDEIAPQDPDAIAATGYLRHWIYEYNQRDVRTQWDNIINDVTDVTADVFLATGIGCARCHDHKFDPIPQRDYFRMRAFFAPLLPRDDVGLGSPQDVAHYRQRKTEWENATASIREELASIEKPHADRARKAAADKFPPDIRPMIMATPEKRRPLEHQLAELAWRQLRTEVEKLDFQKILKGEQKDRWLALRKKLSEFDSLLPKPLPNAFTVSDVGPEAPETYLPGSRHDDVIDPGFLSVLHPGKADIAPRSNSTGRRTALANWIASPDNPLSTRVIVNRIWQYHFGAGLVETSSDFGRLGNAPSHPELLDWLTRQFIDGHWRFKNLHRLILNSSVYRQSSLSPASELAKRIDPHNRLYWRAHIRRLNAEQIRDAMLAASGELKRQRGGPSVEDQAMRRSVYSKVLRNKPDPFLYAFDRPDGVFGVAQRNVTTTPTQSLMMINSPWTLARAEAMARQLMQEESESDGRLVSAMRRTWGRHPSPEELQSAVALVRQQQQRLEKARENLAANTNWIAPIPLANLSGVHLGPESQLKALTVPPTRFPKDEFTIEAVIYLRSLYPNAAVRTIVSQWDNQQAHPGWSLGVTSEKSSYQPRNLILQLIGNDANGKRKYEVIASNLRPELNRPYHVSVRVDLDDASPQGIRFTLRDLSKPDGETMSANVAHTVVANLGNERAIVFGGRQDWDGHFWDGALANVRIHRRTLADKELAIAAEPVQNTLIGNWPFQQAEAMRRDKQGQHDLLTAVGASFLKPPELQALEDFCHALLNTNETIYVD